jgi:hypothetical protein
MPVFTIETTYRLPIYRHRTYEADTLEEACRLAIADEDWWDQKQDYDNSGATYVSGAWPGEDAAYRAPAIPVPSRFDEAVRRKAEHFAVLLGLLKQLAPADAAARHRQGRSHSRRRRRSRLSAPSRRPHASSSPPKWCARSLPRGPRCPDA